MQTVKRIQIPEDSQFLADQHEGRKMTIYISALEIPLLTYLLTMGPEDREFRLKEQKKMQQKLEETRRTEKAKY